MAASVLTGAGLSSSDCLVIILKNLFELSFTNRVTK